MTTIDLENNFFGRRSKIDLLKRRVIDLREGYRQNVAFIGDRYIGKSAILKRFIFELEEEGVVPVYVDLENKDLRYFFRRYAGSLLFHYSKSKDLILHQDLKLLLESTRKHIPQTVEAIKRIEHFIAKGKLSEAYRDTIALPEVFSIESGLFCIILLDEFHNLEGFPVGGVFQELGKKIMTQKKCLYVVTSSLGDVAKEILSEKLSLLFGNFEVINVSGFDLKTSQEFLRENLKGLSMGPVLQNFLIDFTGGYPFYLNIISKELIEQAAVHKQSEIFVPLLNHALENTIFNRWGILSRHFELTVDNLCSGKGNRVILAILIALAGGQHKLAALQDNLRINKNILSLKLNRLIELGIVIKNGNFYYIQDKLFKYWIKYVLERRLQAIDPDPRTLRQQFKTEVEGLINSFGDISKRDLPSRIIELLRCFDSISFHMNGRRYKLPTFGKILPFKISVNETRQFDVIKASSQEGDWFIALKEEGVCESDVATFIHESKQMAQKPQQRIIISLNDLDANARLKALQEKMWIWNEREINALLNLYDKPYIVKC